MDPFDLLRFLTDDRTRKILSLTWRKPLNAIELSRILKIARGHLYRIIHNLEKVGLILCVGTRFARLYQSQLYKAHIIFKGEKLEANYQLRSGASKHIECNVLETEKLGYFRYTSEEITPLSIAKLIGDIHSTKLLAATFEKPRGGIKKISSEYGIPEDRCHRRVHLLVQVGLLKPVDKEGKKIIYQSQLKRADIYFLKDKLKVNFKMR